MCKTKVVVIPGLRRELQQTSKNWDMGGSSVVLKADQEAAIADVQRQEAAVRSGDALPMNKQPCRRIAGQRQGRERSPESARHNQNNKSRVGKKIEHECQADDAQAPIEKFGEEIMYMTSKNRSKSAPKVDAKFHAKWSSEREECEKTSREPEVRGGSAERTRNTVKTSARCGRPRIEVSGSRHAERGEDEHAPAQECEQCDILPTVAATDPTVRRLYTPGRTSENTAS